MIALAFRRFYGGEERAAVRSEATSRRCVVSYGTKQPNGEERSNE